MSSYTTLNIKVKIKVPLAIEAIRKESPELFETLVEKYKKEILNNIITKNLDAKEFWIKFLDIWELAKLN